MGTLTPRLLLVFVVLGSARAQEPFRQLSDWQPLFQGVALVHLEASEPRPMRGHAVRVRLSTPGLRFFATPSNGDQPAHTNGLKTSSFLTHYHCQVAINAAPFQPIYPAEGLPQEIVGLTVSDGEVVSPERPGYPALLITKDNRVSIAEPPFSLDGVHTAVCGFNIVLRAGKPIIGRADIHPRTAVGVTADGQTLYLLVIDGRQPDYSLGATTGEVGQWLGSLGAAEGLNLDGGGTTTLVIAEKTGFKLINRPIHAGKPGTERVSASHLGLYAPPLPPTP